MNATPTFTLGQLVELVRGRYVGPATDLMKTVSSVAPIHDAAADSITWLAEEKHSRHLAETRAAAVIGSEKLIASYPRGIVVSDPDVAVAEILDKFLIPQEPPEPGIHPQAIVHSSAKLGRDVRIGAFAVIHPEATIGERTIVHEGVTIGRRVAIGSDCTIYDRCVLYDRSILGNRVILHAGVVIGADGFGYIFRNQGHRKLAHIGNVIIEDDVEIGPNSVVDRGKLGPTRIGRGTKIDALVMVGHNVQIGPLCVLAGQAGLSGSVRLGAGVALGGQVGISHGIVLGDQARVGAQSGVMSDIPAGTTFFGTPAEESSAAMRAVARVRRLQKLHEEVARLAGRVKALEAATDDRKHG